MHAARTPPAVDEAALSRGTALLRRGGLVAFPTETVYGLGADAFNTTAVARIFQVKGRPHFDPLIVHVAEVAAARRLASTWPDIAQRLADAFWPGPLTLVLPKQPDVPDLVTAGLPTVAVRVPAHPVALALIRGADVPVAAPSANRFGGVSPTTAAHVQQELGPQIDLVLDGGPCQTGVESTVVSLIEPDQPRVLRLGGVTLEAMRDVIGTIAVTAPHARGDRDAEAKGQQSPGMLERHYAPRTPLELLLAEVVRDPHFAPRPHEGLLVFTPIADKAGEWGRVEVLSQSGDMVEAAANLYAAMRRLDATGLAGIVAERLPDEGLGRAINDRLRRAAAR